MVDGLRITQQLEESRDNDELNEAIRYVWFFIYLPKPSSI